ncbi:MAG: N-formylglutamate amidohydrolase, partial [Paracoccaceae bacterium]
KTTKQKHKQRKQEQELTRERDTYGRAVLFDCHSKPSDALRAAPRIRGELPQIVLGDRFGAAAARHIIAETQEAFEAEGFRVARNAPFAGGYITQRYGRPSRGFHAIQIEIDRGLYLDQSRIIPSADFADISRRLAAVISRLALIPGQMTALAAE